MYNYIKGKTDALYAAKSHTHTSLVDSTDASSTCSMSYLASAKKYNEYNWVAVWDGKTIKSASKADFASSGHNHNIQDLNNYAAHIWDATTVRPANAVLIGPNGSNGEASFRKLVAADLPSHTHNYAGSSSAGGAANSAMKLVAIDSKDAGFYVTNDSHILKLGYVTCNSSYGSTVLLISSTFWGAQHGSTDIIHIYNHQYTDGSDVGVKANLGRIRVSGSRDFYYTIDVTNKRVYLYVKVTGGNSYGSWNISTLQIENVSWVTSLESNQTLKNAIVVSEPNALVGHEHTCMTNSDIDALF